MTAHFFDLDTLIRVESSVWIVSKTSPSSPIIRISQSEFNLIQSGVYRKFNSELNISGKRYWLPENLLNSLKIKAKKKNIDITNLAFSMQEFLSPEIIKDLPSQILSQNFQHLKNKPDDIYVICSKASKYSMQSTIKKLESELFSIGLQIKDFYYISETFYNRDLDEIAHKKIRLLLQHLIGYKSLGDKFSDERITQYDKISYYDSDYKSIQLAKNINDLLKSMLNLTDESLQKDIKESIQKGLELQINEVTSNLMMPFITQKINLELNHLIKTFESFNYLK